MRWIEIVVIRSSPRLNSMASSNISLLIGNIPTPIPIILRHTHRHRRQPPRDLPPYSPTCAIVAVHLKHRAPVPVFKVFHLVGRSGAWGSSGRRGFRTVGEEKKALAEVEQEKDVDEARQHKEEVDSVVRLKPHPAMGVVLLLDKGYPSYNR